jgi:hypothetical protein
MIIFNMVVRYALSSFAARILHYTLYIYKKFLFFFIFFIFKISYILCGQVTFKKGFRGDFYGVKKYQGSPQGLETIEKADEAFMQTIRNGE